MLWKYANDLPAFLIVAKPGVSQSALSHNICGLEVRLNVQSHLP